jgi:type IV secretion system protein VirB8
MSMLHRIKSLLKREERLEGAEPEVVAPSLEQVSQGWYADKYESLVVQRNILFIMLIASILLVVFLNFSISFIKSTKSIEPFVIEIEPKTGVPTVVQPLSAVAYTADEVINRYFVWSYVKLRESYSFATYRQALKDVRLFSNDLVYGQYRRIVDQNNLQSPYNLYGQNSVSNVELKSLVMQDKNTAQVRIRIVVEGIQSGAADKIVVMRFEYNNLEMSDDKRLINPLGFMVTSYRIDDERL